MEFLENEYVCMYVCVYVDMYVYFCVDICGVKDRVLV